MTTIRNNDDWSVSAIAGRQLQEARAALAARVEPATVDDDVAPLLNELLPRMDTLWGELPAIEGPGSPGAHYGPADRVRFLARAQPHLDELATADVDGPIAAAAAIVRAHLQLATEVALRTGV